MPTRLLRPRCTIQLINVLGEVVPLLDEGAQITPATGRTRYREYWTEEEDLDYVYRQPVVAPDGSMSKVDWPGGVHGNFGYELLVAEASGKFSLEINFFTVLPSTANGRLDLEYEPKLVSMSGVLGRGGKVRIDTELQAGFSEQVRRPDFKFLRVTCKR